VPEMLSHSYHSFAFEEVTEFGWKEFTRRQELEKVKVKDSLEVLRSVLLKHL